MEAELAELAGKFTNREVVNSSSSMVQINLRRTKFSKLTMRVHFRDNYPNEAAVTELSSNTLPARALNRITKQCDKEAARLVGGPQLMQLVALVKRFVDHNMLLYCLDDVRKMKELCEKHQGTFKTNEETGVIKFRISKGEYYFGATITVPAAYPEVGAHVTAPRSNFSRGIVNSHMLQVEEVVRRCVVGYSAEAALAGSNPIKLPPKLGSDGLPTVVMSSEHMKDIKHDVRFLQKAADLRAVDTAKCRGVQAHSTKERRSARRELKQLSKAEASSDAAQEARNRENQLRDMMEGMEAMGTGEDSVPSLWPVAQFLVNRFALQLPDEICQACQKPVFPSDPAVAAAACAAAGAARTDKKPRKIPGETPTRVYCGHWLHHACLDSWMTTPPFGKTCKHDGKQLYHPDWTADVQQLERTWANKQAKQREFCEVSDFLDFGDEFSR